MTLDHRSIMSGERKDPLAVILRGALRVASWPYGVAVAVRNRRFDSGAREIHRCAVPVISVGNLTTGGTGKTPIVCFLAKWFRAKGIRVALVSRGYGRGQADANDEAMELHARLPDVPHIQNPDRVEAAQLAVDELEAQVILMDDGMQHRRLHRDLNLVVIDATCPFGYGYLLPRGLLREPLEALRRADLVILTRCDTVDESVLQEIETDIRAVVDSVPLVRSSHRPTGLLEHPDSVEPIENLEGQNVAVVSAIGNPLAFEQTLRHCGATIVDSRRLADHDPYGPETLQALMAWARSLGDKIDRVVCTHKDLVKLQTDRLGGKPLAAVLIELSLLSGCEAVEEALDEVARLCESP